MEKVGKFNGQTKHSILVTIKAIRQLPFMSFKLKTPGGERAGYALMCFGIGVYLAISWLKRGDISGGLFGSLMIVTGVGMWFNHKWARWIGIALGLFATGYIIFKMSQRGLSLLGCAGVVTGFWGTWGIWKEFKPEKIAADSAGVEKPRAMISLALLLESYREMDEHSLARIVSSAWGVNFLGGDDAKDDSASFVVGKPPMFVIQSPEAFYIAYTFPSPYFNDLNKVANELKEMRIAKAVKDHQAWLAVDLISIHDPSQPPESVYPQIAKLVAELASPDALAIYQPETGKITPWDETLESTLRGSDALSVFGKPIHPPVVHIDDDDPQMLAAVAEARARWPEFVEAFKQQSGGTFSIKASITSGERTEFIWVDVVALVGDSIQGRLGNQPVKLEDFKLGDGVEVSVKEVNDWVFVQNQKPTGLFTVKVLEQKFSGKSNQNIQ